MLRLGVTNRTEATETNPSEQAKLRDPIDYLLETESASLVDMGWSSAFSARGSVMQSLVYFFLHINAPESDIPLP